MRKFKNSIAIKFRKLAEVEQTLRRAALEKEATSRGVKIEELVRIKQAEARQAQIRAQKPKRELTRRAKPPDFRETARKQRWDGTRWVTITEKERVNNG